MAKDLEGDLKTGRSIQDMIRTEGWQVYKARIQKEIKEAYDEMRGFDMTGKSLPEIGAEYIRHRERVNAFEDSLDFIKEFLKSKENAENRLR